MDLVYLFKSLLRKKWIIIFSGIVGLAAGVVFARTIRTTYTSLAQYSTGFTMGQKVKIQGSDGLNIFEIDFQFRNVIETFRSPKVLGMVGYNLLLHDLESKTPFRYISEEYKKHPSYSALSKERVIQILKSKVVNMELLNNYVEEERHVINLLGMYRYNQESLVQDMLVERATGTDYLNIWFKSEHPELSAFVVNNAGEEFSRFFSRIYATRTTESVVKLDSLTAAKKKELDDKTKLYEQFRSKLGSPDIAGRSLEAMKIVNDAMGRYTDETTKLNQLKAQLKSVNDQLLQLGSATPGSTSTTNNNAEVLRLRNENISLAQQLQQKGGTDPDIQKQIDDNNRKILALSPANTGGGTRATKLQEQRDELNRRKFDLTAEIAAAELNVKEHQEKMNKYETLSRTGGDQVVMANAFESELKILTNEYEYLKNRVQASQDVNVAPEINFKSTLVGQPSVRPDPSKKLLVIGISGAGMFFVSAFLIVLLDLLDTSLKTPSVFLRNTRLKLLSSINRVNLRKKDVADFFAGPNDPDRKTNDAVFLENLRKLRYEIENSGKRIFLFTSNKPKEGKTTIMEALANGFSASKKKVLMIDSNFSNNTLTRKYEAKPTLEEFSVNGEKNPLEKFYKITSVTKIPNVDMVGCSEGNYTPAEILPKNNLLENLRTVSDHYDYVFIEGAALNNHADSKELSKYVDGIVSVFSSKSVIRQTDKESIQFLKRTGDKYVGAVLNGVEAENLDL
ncbi:MAG TPA: Wzz/FepE/Etk N-terminal domain-containing protein [Chitinophagaceae bacterium]|nr:Wzz/FepE/Etk N-terminal domain-containing protein [Chitinophagaceae bacterium]